MRTRGAIALVLAASLGASLAAALSALADVTAGSPDASYAGSGAVLDDFYGTNSPDVGHAVAIQSDGKIVAAGSSGTGGFSPVTIVARYNADGTRDSTFGPPPHGFFLQQICIASSCGSAEADAVAIQSDGKIVEAGIARNGAGFYVMRLTTDGARDTTFNAGGANSQPAGDNAFQIGGVTTNYAVGGIAIQSDGKIVVAGTANGQSFTARLLADGSALDTSGWNSPSGFLLGTVGTSFTGLALQPSDGKAVAVGSVGTMLRVERFLTNGMIDTTFFSGSAVHDTNIGAGPDAGAGIIATSDKLIVDGTDQTGASAAIGLCEFRQSDGALDPTLNGGTGQERIPLPGGDAAAVNTLARDGSGRLLVAGQDTTASRAFVARLSGGGSPDTDFGSGGFSIPAFGASALANGVASDASGNVVIAGAGKLSGRTDNDLLTARLLGTTPPPPPAPTTTTTTTPPTNTTPAPTPPVLSTLTQTHSRWREGSNLPSLARRRRPPIGTTFAFSLDQGSSVTFAFRRQLPGRLVKGKCVAQTRRNTTKRPCTRSVAAGALTVAAHAGNDRLAFQGRLANGKRLPLGRYAVTAVATNAAGQSSVARSLRFTIVR